MPPLIGKLHPLLVHFPIALVMAAAAAELVAIATRRHAWHTVAVANLRAGTAIGVMSRIHSDRPYTLSVNGTSHEVRYEPAESRSPAFGTRPASGTSERYQRDPHWRDLILFHVYFHGDTGVGLGACHQTGWTALVAKLLQQTG
jgi:hypothetical protein